MTKTIVRFGLLMALVAFTGLACDSSPLVAPVASTISVFTSAKTVHAGGTVDVAAHVIEEAGTPVHDGTLVRFSVTLGTVEPTEARTRDGVATTTFTAGTAAGTAKITATSGAATAGEPSNVAEIVIG